MSKGDIMVEFDKNEYILANKMKVFFIHKRVRGKIIIGSVRFDIDDDFYLKGNTVVKIPIGLSHICEHMNFYKDCKNIYDSFIKYGSAVNAITCNFGSLFWGSASYNFNNILKLIMDLMLKPPIFTYEQYKNELKIIKSEISSFDENDPYEKTCILYKEYFGSCRSLHQIVGKAEIVEDIPMWMVMDSLKRFYIPERMSIFIGGDNLDEHKILDKMTSYINRKYMVKR